MVKRVFINTNSDFPFFDTPKDDKLKGADGNLRIASWGWLGERTIAIQLGDTIHTVNQGSLIDYINKKKPGTNIKKGWWCFGWGKNPEETQKIIAIFNEIISTKKKTTSEQNAASGSASSPEKVPQIESLAENFKSFFQKHRINVEHLEELKEALKQASKDEKAPILLDAMKAQEYDIVKMLLTIKGFDVNACNTFGLPLIFQIFSLIESKTTGSNPSPEEDKIVQKLKELFASLFQCDDLNVDFKAPGNKSFLTFAKNTTYEEGYQLILQHAIKKNNPLPKHFHDFFKNHGIDSNLTKEIKEALASLVENNKLTILLAAVQEPQYDIVNMLLSMEGFNVNCRSEEGESPLASAIISLDKKMIQQLIKSQRINLDIKINEKTPLLYLLEKVPENKDAADIFLILFDQDEIDKRFPVPLLNLCLQVFPSLSLDSQILCKDLFTELVKRKSVIINDKNEQGVSLLCQILINISLNHYKVEKVETVNLLKGMLEFLFETRDDLDVNPTTPCLPSPLIIALAIPNYQKGVELILAKSSETIINQALALNRGSEEYKVLLFGALDR
jgi:hypothetical protein